MNGASLLDIEFHKDFLKQRLAYVKAVYATDRDVQKIKEHFRGNLWIQDKKLKIKTY